MPDDERYGRIAHQAYRDNDAVLTPHMQWEHLAPIQRRAWCAAAQAAIVAMGEDVRQITGEAR